MVVDEVFGMFVCSFKPFHWSPRIGRVVPALRRRLQGCGLLAEEVRDRTPLCGVVEELPVAVRETDHSGLHH